ncbi:MAG: hypothetical protein IJ809_04480 [Clostridia bacterium]|nr:hypothetical protein [Clostridia bacterium]
MRLKTGKNGDILYVYILFVFITILLILIFIIIVSRYYFVLKITSVKRDLFYIGQDAARAALDVNKLSYSEYSIDEDILNNIASRIIEKNYGDSVILEEIKFNESSKTLYIKVNLNIRSFVPNVGGSINVKLDENMKIKLMEVDK